MAKKTEIPRCKQCHHTPYMHDHDIGSSPACMAVMEDGITMEQCLCLCPQFIPPNNWTYDPPLDGPCKCKGGTHPEHKPVIMETNGPESDYVSDVSCHWCEAKFRLRPATEREFQRNLDKEAQRNNSGI